MAGQIPGKPLFSQLLICPASVCLGRLILLGVENAVLVTLLQL
jgi:hypothetical protein